MDIVLATCREGMGSDAFHRQDQFFLLTSMPQEYLT